MIRAKNWPRRAAAALAAAFMVFSAFVLRAPDARGEDLPSTFYNDEAWYKDEILPYVFRDGKYFVPLEIFPMFGYIDVSVSKDENILLENTLDGSYISILFSDGTAAANGEIIDSVGIFRSSGVFYVAADDVAPHVGLGVEYNTDSGGTVRVRLYDSSKKLSFSRLLYNYTGRSVSEEVSGRITIADDVPLKRIYILCSFPSENPYAISASSELDRCGVRYTAFLKEGTDIDVMIDAYAGGAFGFVSEDGDPGKLDAMNSTYELYTSSRSRLVLDTGDEEMNSALSAAGYVIITPDITVNGSSSASGAYEEMMALLDTYGKVTVYLDDCWNSGQIARMISNIEDVEYVPLNMYSDRWQAMIR